MRGNDLFAFIRKRYDIARARAEGYSKPWTNDPILRAYRFCNVYREWDTETQWISKHWREPNTSHPDLWFAMLIARTFNWHETLHAIKFPLPFDNQYANRLQDILNERNRMGQKIWTGAYMASTHGKRAASKHHFFIERVFIPAWYMRNEIRPVVDDTLESFYNRLLKIPEVGSFTAGQVIADLKYAKGSPLHQADDWGTWAVMGPGSKRGLNRVFERDKRTTWSGDSFKEHLGQLQKYIDRRVAAVHDMPAIHAQDLQNCLCEFDKYERVRLGEGFPRSRYNGV